MIISTTCIIWLFSRYGNPLIEHLHFLCFKRKIVMMWVIYSYSCPSVLSVRFSIHLGVFILVWRIQCVLWSIVIQYSYNLYIQAVIFKHIKEKQWKKENESPMTHLHSFLSSIWFVMSSMPLLIPLNKKLF